MILKYLEETISRLFFISSTHQIEEKNTEHETLYVSVPRLYISNN